MADISYMQLEGTWVFDIFDVIAANQRFSASGSEHGCGVETRTGKLEWLQRFLLYSESEWWKVDWD